MRNLRHCATHRGRVRPLDDLIQFAEAEAAHDLFLRLRKRNRAAVILDFDLSRVGFSFLRRCHNSKLKTQNFIGLRPAYLEGAPLQTDLSSSTDHRKLRAQRCADLSIPKL